MYIGSDWSLEFLQNLIENQVQESIDLEYKNSLALNKKDRCKDEISKDVSAFANSAGGVIIYGIEEQKHVPVKIDDGVDPNEISKEWLEQVISSRIQRKIDNIRIHQIPINDSNVAYVVEIPQSSRAPHQAKCRAPN